VAAALDFAVPASAEPRAASLAGELGEVLADAGHEAVVHRDRLPPVVPGRVTVLVPPRTGFDAWVATEPALGGGVLRHCVALCPGPLSSAAAEALRGCRGAAALMPAAVHMLRLAGIDGALLPPAAPLHVPAESARDVDVVLCEGWTPARWRLAASLARVLDGREADLRVSYVGETRAGVEHLPGTAERRALLARARIALIAGGGRALDLLAALEAAACGALVLTDAEVDLGPFAAGESIVRASAAALPTAIDALLADLAALRRIAAAGNEVARRQPLAATAEALAAVAEAGTHLLPRARPRPVPVPRPASGEAGTGDAVAAASLSELRRLRRRIERLEHAGRLEETVTATPAWAPAAPELSVIVPLHDYERYVEAACASVAAAEGVCAELIVVDDASHDRGAEVVERFLAAHPALPALLVRLPANAGIAGARNAGASRARTDELLFLDADDQLLPHGPLRLHEALAADPGAAFAYGLIALEAADGPRGLVSSEPWNPDLLRDGNYINALALVRAEPFRAVGGFHAEGLLELGWEDYDLWLRFAARGLRGAHVRQIVARYRVHEGSRTATADLVADRLMDELRERFGEVLA
jgi:hypothetical protein